MAKTLVVVESPAKAKTIKKYLGAKYDVMASKGHIKDLPKKLGIDIEKGFLETYEVVPGKEKVVQELKAAAKGADQVLLATDPDREGEAIAWHIMEELKSAKKVTKRVEFHEITEKGVKYGVAHPRELDKDLYDAQRCRRVLDRIVGYDVSALVWSKLAFGLSAGRVQSVALRLIVDREREIEAFVPEEYWNCGAALAKTNGGEGGPGFLGRLAMRDGEKLAVKTGDEAARVRADLEGATYRVSKISKAERKRHSPAPYTTSKLQPDAVRKHLKDEQFKLYKLIWERFVASQMIPAVYDQTSVDIEAKCPGGVVYGLRASGRVLKVSGWLDAYGKKGEPAKAPELAGEGEGDAKEEGADPKRAKDLLADDAEASLPELAEGEVLRLVTPPGVVTEQKFTQPPARYSEASLVKELDTRGIVPPSTYAEIISKVQARDYVGKLDGARAFRPTTLGKFVVDGLIGSELDFMDPAFTSKMEEELDEVEAGKEHRVDLVKGFYKRFPSQPHKSNKGKRWNPAPRPTRQRCEVAAGGQSQAAVT